MPPDLVPDRPDDSPRQLPLSARIALVRAPRSLLEAGQRPVVALPVKKNLRRIRQPNSCGDYCNDTSQSPGGPQSRRLVGAHHTLQAGDLTSSRRQPTRRWTILQPKYSSAHYGYFGFGPHTRSALGPFRSFTTLMTRAHVHAHSTGASRRRLSRFVRYSPSFVLVHLPSTRPLPLPLMLFLSLLSF